VHRDAYQYATQKAKDLVAMGVARARLLNPLSVESVPANRDVLVIGGGVTGIQAALNLADSGIKVQLVEQDSTIGGWMARLNDVFPKNDCSMCVLAPKMNEAADHPNINLHKYQETKNNRGHIGDYHISVVHNPRNVDEYKYNSVNEMRGFVFSTELTLEVEREST